MSELRRPTRRRVSFPGFRTDVAMLIVAMIAVIGIAPDLRAATYRIPSDDVLVAKAPVIVRGAVTRIESHRDPRGGIETEITVSASKVLKGPGGPRSLVVRQPGGAIGDESMVVPGIGSFMLREEVLLLLEPTTRGYRLVDFALGKFHVGRAGDGSEFLRRDGLAEAHIVSPPLAASAAGSSPGPSALDPDRDAAGFERFVLDIGSGKLPDFSYVLPEQVPESGASVDFTFLDDPNGVHSRRNEFDTGGTVTYKDNASGDPGTLCASDGCHGAVAAGVVDWNSVPGALISLAYGGTDGTIGSKCLVQLTDQIQFNDPCDDVTNLTGCAGTLAIGGFFSTSSGGVTACSSMGSPLFHRITRAFIVVNNGVGSCLSTCNYEDMIAHETGHTIGAGHSSDPNALMAPVLTAARCGVPQADDNDFATCAYPAQILSCNVTAIPTSGRNPLLVAFNSGSAGGAAPLSFSWDFGDGGSDTDPTPNHTYQAPGLFTASLTVMDANSQTCTDSIDIDVQPCISPVMTTVTPRVKNGLLKAVVVGTGFRKGTTVQIDSGGGFVSAPKTIFKTKTKIIGRDVAAIWPAGIAVMIRVLSSTGCPSNALAATR